MPNANANLGIHKKKFPTVKMRYIIASQSI